jgi:hypothetical protein
LVVLAHPLIQLEIARQRQADLIARAARKRIAHVEPDESESTPTFLELAHRVDGGVEVSLLWRQLDNRIAVTVSDTRSGDWFVLDADHAEALEVFYHPYAHAGLEEAA